MKKEVTLNLKEQKRLLVLNEVLTGRLTGQEAAEVLGLVITPYSATHRRLSKGGGGSPGSRQPRQAVSQTHT